MPHSKGPFTYIENSWSDTSLYDGHGRRVALLSIAYDCDEDSQAEWEKRQAADAAVLLEALNVHEQTGLTPAQLQARVAELEGALAAWQEVQSDLFGHCLSNGVFNAWQKPFDCTKLNEAHEQTARVMRNA